jgi:hypothetical protein
MVDLCPKVKWSISLAYVLWTENRSSVRMVKNKMADFTIWKLYPENDHLNTELSGFQMVTV